MYFNNPSDFLKAILKLNKALSMTEKDVNLEKYNVQHASGDWAARAIYMVAKPGSKYNGEICIHWVTH